ncbi:MAG: metallophosphoesterase, partial [Mailhella sp.]|nr:metallophosphoesterase [Mailhella sp.]
MTVLQLSDPHTEAPGKLAYGVADTSAMLHEAVRHIKGLRQKPEMVVVSGDISCNGCPGGYRTVADALGQLDIPVFVLPGNHDDREQLMRHLGHLCPADPHTAPELCY